MLLVKETEGEKIFVTQVLDQCSVFKLSSRCGLLAPQKSSMSLKSLL